MRPTICLQAAAQNQYLQQHTKHVCSIVHNPAVSSQPHQAEAVGQYVCTPGSTLSLHRLEAGSHLQGYDEATCMQVPPPGFTPEAQHAAQDKPIAQEQDTAAAMAPAQQKRVRQVPHQHACKLLHRMLQDTKHVNQ